MDPDCAICHAASTLNCDCEAKGLEVSIRQAEARVMGSIYNDIRSWVRGHAQDYILNYYKLLSDRRKAAHSEHLDHLTAHASYYYHSQPHPNEIIQAQASLKRGLDEDWCSSVQRYPEVLEYFYSQVNLTLPHEDESRVKDPPLSALNGPRRASRRAAEGFQLEASRRSTPAPRGRTPPPPAIEGRRTPAPPALPYGAPPPANTVRRMSRSSFPAPSIAYGFGPTPY